VIEVSERDKLNEVLKYLSDHHTTDLTGAALMTVENVENRNLVDNKLESIVYNLYFTKEINPNLTREFHAAVVRNEDGTIKIISFEINDIVTQPPSTSTDPSGSSSTTG